MSDAIVVAIIGGGFSLIAAVVAAQISAKSTMQKALAEMDKRIALSEVKHQADIALLDQKVNVILTEQQEMKKDIKEHNGYGKLFAESKVEMADMKNDINEIKQMMQKQ